jgi:two-component system OmpR family response regulator
MDTVMVVDDDPAIRELFTLFLMKGGYATLEASGGPECIEQLKTQKPDLILLDMMMEPMDGWETLLAIRNYPPSRTIPVIIITGKPPVPDEISQYGLLIEDYIVKPIDFRQIVHSLHRVIEKDRDMKHEINRIETGTQDPELLNEYMHLFLQVRLTHNIQKWFREPQQKDHHHTELEERLQWLHKKLGVPDRFLEWNKGG